MRKSKFAEQVCRFTDLVKYFGRQKQLCFDPARGKAELHIESPQGNCYMIPIQSIDGGEPVIVSMGHHFPTTIEGLASCIFLLADRKRTAYQECVAYLRQ